MRIISEDLERLYAISKELYSIDYYKAARITKEAAKIIEAISKEYEVQHG